MIIASLVATFTLSILSASDANKFLKVVSTSTLSNIKNGSNSSSKKRKKLRVIGAGLGRTGTSSLQAALNILGYTTYDMVENVMHDHSNLWSEAMLSQEGSTCMDHRNSYHDCDNRKDSRTSGEEKKGRKADIHFFAIRSITDALAQSGYDATTDDPAADLAIELLQEYPEAKVILTTRMNPERWYSSIQQLNLAVTIVNMSLFGFLPTIRRLIRLANIIQGHPRRKCFGGTKKWLYLLPYEYPDKEACLDYYHSHNNMIRSSVPPSQLLEYQLGDGWEPLCDFLGKPVPEGVPFPHENDALSIWIGFVVFIITNLLFCGIIAYVVVLPFRWYYNGRSQRQDSKED